MVQRNMGPHSLRQIHPVTIYRHRATHPHPSRHHHHNHPCHHSQLICGCVEELGV